MSLRRKMFVKEIALLLCVVAMVCVCLWGLVRQRQHVQGALNEYTALQKVELAQGELTEFQQRAHAGLTLEPASIAHLKAAFAYIREYKAMIGQYDSLLPPEITSDMQLQVRAKTKSLVASLATLNSQLAPRHGMPSTMPVELETALNQVDAASLDLGELLALCNGFVHRTELESQKDVRAAIWGVSVLAGCALIGAVGASVWQYRRIMVPLQRLRQWCRVTADGDFSLPYVPTEDREFQELGSDVNRMARELDAFYRRLEAMVTAKSRDLVRSERLASVGYLAAGVAHEINNPLNIMSGYAEISIKRLRRLQPSAVDNEILQHLSIIRGEAFRCKEITTKLLSLAKGSGDVREVISAADAITEVVSLVRGLKSLRGKTLRAVIPPDDPLWVRANPTEIKQVLLNLVVNGIEAVPVDSGVVEIRGEVGGTWIEMSVCDNGRGMNEQTRERVFEPFFTNKRGSGEPGTGLGLSITHAIVTQHGGEISASSEGPGQGSRFTVRLPVAPPEERPEKGLRIPTGLSMPAEATEAVQ